MKQSIHAKRMERHHKRLKQGSKLNLVSLMDIFTILVFFLLVNSSDVEVLQNNKDITLPTSVAEQKPENTLVVMVSQEEILVGGRKVADVSAVLKSDDREIAGLKKEMEYLAKRRKAELAAQSIDALEQALEEGLQVTIMGDETIPYTLLKRIMGTCAASEYRSISLAVSQITDDSAVPESSGMGG